MSVRHLAFSVFACATIAAAWQQQEGSPGPTRRPLRDFTKFTVAELGLQPVPAKIDPKTGFTVGGTNTTSLIRRLRELRNYLKT